MRQLLVTGANGFVGRQLCSKAETTPGLILQRVYGPSGRTLGAGTAIDLTSQFDLSSSLRNVHVVVHLGSRVHILADKSTDSLKEFRRVNVAGTTRLLEQAGSAGVRRFIYVSSIKVNGESTLPGKPFRACDTPAPEEPYAKSKWEAEEQVKVAAQKFGMEFVIIRPPLVYGPGVGANFARLIRAVRNGVPLPLGSIRNRRSLVGLQNLVDLLWTCLSNEKARDQTFLVSDNDDISTPQLLDRVGKAFGRPPRLLPMPERLLKAAFVLTGQRALGERLCDSLEVDIQPTMERLDWKPPVRMSDELLRIARAFLENETSRQGAE